MSLCRQSCPRLPRKSLGILTSLVWRLAGWQQLSLTISPMPSSLFKDTDNRCFNLLTITQGFVSVFVYTSSVEHGTASSESADEFITAAATTAWGRHPVSANRTST